MHSNQGHVRAFSLVEMMVSMVAMTVLMAGLTLAVTIAGRAVPDPESVFSAELDGFHAIEQIAGELTNLTGVTEKSASVIEFQVADRNSDGNPETIRYQWSGTAGAPLTRKYNTDAPVTVAADVQEFELQYANRTSIESTLQTVSGQTPESVLGSFSGWTGYTPTATQRAASLTSWVSEYFLVTPPTDAISLTFTRAEVRLKGSTLLPPPGATVGIHRSKNDGTYAPAAASIGLPVTVLPTSLTTAYQPIPINFVGVVASDPIRTDYCLVVKGTASTSAWVDTFFNTTAPDNGMYEQITTDAGSSWTITSANKNKQDVRFTIWGYFNVLSEELVATNRDYLISTRVILRIGPHAPSRLETSVQTMNEPEVTGL